MTNYGTETSHIAKDADGTWHMHTDRPTWDGNQWIGFGDKRQIPKEHEPKLQVYPEHSLQSNPGYTPQW